MAAAKHKLIRNLTHLTLRMRFGSKRDPFHVELKPRGLRGDVASIPLDVMSHPAFDANQGRTFEVITKTVADKAAESYPEGGIVRHPIYADVKVEVTRDREDELTVAEFNISERGRITEVNRDRGALRQRKQMGPDRAEVPGSEDGPPIVEREQPKGRVNPAEAPLPKFKGVERGHTV